MKKLILISILSIFFYSGCNKQTNTVTNIAVSVAKNFLKKQGLDLFSDEDKFNELYTLGLAKFQTSKEKAKEQLIKILFQTDNLEFHKKTVEILKYKGLIKELIAIKKDILFYHKNNPEIKNFYNKLEFENSNLFTYGDKNIDFKIWADKKSYKIGENITLYFKSNKDCMINIFNINSRNEMQRLFPNEHSNRSNMIKKGKTYSFPSQEDGFEYEASDPVGIECIKVIITENEESDIAIKDNKQAFETITEKPISYTRGIKIKAKKKSKKTSSSVKEVNTYLEIRN